VSVYYLLWLAAALLVVAVLSAAITWRVRFQVERRLKAARLLDAMAQYSGWVAAQRRLAFVWGDEQEIEPQLGELRNFAEDGFTALAPEFGEIFTLHTRLMNFLHLQQRQREGNLEAWLEADHEATFVELWRLQRRAVQAGAVELQRIAGIPEAQLQTGIFSA
jgi:hypothetical protein